MEMDAVELIAEYLRVTGDLPREEVARIAGVRPAIIDSWECTPRKQLRLATRERLTAYLDERMSPAQLAR